MKTTTVTKNARITTKPRRPDASSHRQRVFVFRRIVVVSVFKTYGPRRDDFFKTFPPLS
jgi:hypothetical protein